MVKSSDKTNTGEGDKGKKGKTVSDDVDFVDKVKDKRRTKNNNLPVSNLYAKTSGRTWRMGGSQI